ASRRTGRPHRSSVRPDRVRVRPHSLHLPPRRRARKGRDARRLPPTPAPCQNTPDPMTNTNSIPKIILHNLVGNDSQWFWAMAHFLDVAITLWCIWRQIHLQRMGNTLASLAQFESRWTSPEMLEARKAICKTFQDGRDCNVQSAERVACFFEEIGLYVKK